MLKKYRSLIFAAVLSISSAANTFAAPNLESQSACSDVEGTIQVIRGMYNATNSGSYNALNNQLLKGNAYGNTVVKAAVSNGETSLDALMTANGYGSYSIEYYYDNSDYSSQIISGYKGPNFVFAVLDGKEYRYYFSDGSMIRRIDPTGTVTDNPKTDEFLNRLYQTGCLYQNDLSQCSASNLSQETIAFSSRHYDWGDQVDLYAAVLKNDEGSLRPRPQEYGLYTVDANTRLSPVIEEEKTWRSGDNGYTWLSRHLDTDPLYGGYIGSLECFQINSTNGHVDYIEGIYATH